jgi:hypothetical protein
VALELAILVLVLHLDHAAPSTVTADQPLPTVKLVASQVTVAVQPVQQFQLPVVVHQRASHLHLVQRYLQMVLVVVRRARHVLDLPLDLAVLNTDTVVPHLDIAVQVAKAALAPVLQAAALVEAALAEAARVEATVEPAPKLPQTVPVEAVPDTLAQDLALVHAVQCTDTVALDCNTVVQVVRLDLDLALILLLQRQAQDQHHPKRSDRLHRQRHQAHRHAANRTKAATLWQTVILERLVWMEAVCQHLIQTLKRSSTVEVPLVHHKLLLNPRKLPRLT